MKTLTVRAVPNHVFETLKKWADLNHRSMQEQVKSILDRETRLIRGARLDTIPKWRKKLAGRKWGNLVKDIRSERQR